MNTIGKNIINELNEIKKDFLTKEDVIQIVSKICAENELPLVESNGVVVNPETQTITINGNEMIVTRKTFDLLYYFIINKNKNLTRNRILRDVWGSDVFVIERTVDVHVRKLRKLLPKNFIKTNKNIGYLWIEKN